MTNLIYKVLEILNNITEIQTVLYDNSSSANVRIDRKPCPAALVYTLPDFKIETGGGVAKEKADIQVFFFDRVQFDSTAEAKLEILENMGLLAREFIYRLLNDKGIMVLDDEINIKATWGEFDSFVAGYVVQITIEERQGSCIWSEPTPQSQTENEEIPSQNG